MSYAPLKFRSPTGRRIAGILVAMTLVSLSLALRATSEPERVPYLHLARILQPISLLLLVSSWYVPADRVRLRWLLTVTAAVPILASGIRFWTAGMSSQGHRWQNRLLRTWVTVSPAGLRTHVDALDVPLALVRMAEQMIREAHGPEPSATSSSPTCSPIGARASVTHVRIAALPALPASSNLLKGAAAERWR